MQYLGGKSKIRKDVAMFLNSVRKPNQIYFEPFVGGGWILQEMTDKRIASDGNKNLISMYKALQNGWVPPENISEEEYNNIKNNKDKFPEELVAFVGFGSSFGGVYYGSYARSDSLNRERNYCLNAKNSLLNQLPKIKDVEFRYGLFQEHSQENMLIYCDPPYEGTSNYDYFDGFDHTLFWNTMRDWSKNNTVVISEYNAPEDFECVKIMHSKMGLRNEENKQELREEKLFMLKGTHIKYSGLSKFFKKGSK